MVVSGGESGVANFLLYGGGWKLEIVFFFLFFIMRVWGAILSLMEFRIMWLGWSIESQ